MRLLYFSVGIVFVVLIILIKKPVTSMNHITQFPTATPLPTETIILDSTAEQERQLFDIPEYTPSGITEKAKVIRLLEKNILLLSNNKRVHYIGLEIPEQCFASESAQTNESLVVGQTVELERDKTDIDEKGNLLRYVYIDGELINDFLVRQGFARIKNNPPDTRYSLEFLKAEQEAKEQKRGLWKACSTS